MEETFAEYYRTKGDSKKELYYLNSCTQTFGSGSADLVIKARLALAHKHSDSTTSSPTDFKNLISPVQSQVRPRPFTTRASKYDLSHLDQFDDQYVIGPIQDDEALFLYALVRGMRISTILELGGLEGYSAKNFLKALGPDGTLFTCDLHPVAAQSHNHRVIIKDCANICAADLLDMPIELIFFDCHEYEAQMACFHALKSKKLLNDSTILALHDTNTHPQRHVDWAYQVQGGFIHQAVERRMVNDFVDLGYHAFCLHTQNNKHTADFPFRHGITIMQKFSPLPI
jgi:predicted O-methyltransferase YrrM